MTAASHNFTIEKGASWSAAVSATVSGTAVNHTGYTVEMDVRPNAASDTVLLALTAGNGRVSIDGSGNIGLSLTDEETAVLTFEYGEYDVRVTSPGGTSNFYLRGKVRVVPSVTR